ncbi:hypothetical protein IC575_014598 [Cucumis melo]
MAKYIFFLHFLRNKNFLFFPLILQKSFLLPVPQIFQSHDRLLHHPSSKSLIVLAPQTFSHGWCSFV